MLNPTLWHVTPLVAGTLPLIVGLALLHGAEHWFREREQVLLAGWKRWLPSPVRALAYTAVAVLLVLMLKTEESTFIYFRF
ncbi:MAG: patA 3, partial [Firmicutes bacterium]|nr:patA 3 [Bacillota bacterium]